MTDSKEDQERDAVLMRMFKTPPKPHKPKPKAVSKKKKKCASRVGFFVKSYMKEALPALGALTDINRQ